MYRWWLRELSAASHDTQTGAITLKQEGNQNSHLVVADCHFFCTCMLTPTPTNLITQHSHCGHHFKAGGRPEADCPAMHTF